MSDWEISEEHELLTAERIEMIHAVESHLERD